VHQGACELLCLLFELDHVVLWAPGDFYPHCRHACGASGTFINKCRHACSEALAEAQPNMGHACLTATQGVSGAARPVMSRSHMFARPRSL
jgi:hypothetical protein